MTYCRKGALLLSIAATIIMSATSCRDKDAGPGLCKPHALLYETDSIVYTYTDGQITKAVYYGSGAPFNQDDVEYNSAGQVATVSKSTIAFDGTLSVESHHTLSYGSDGRPETLVTDSYVGHFTTTFTHNEKAQFATAETSSGFNELYVGATRYEYDNDGNIPKVYYTFMLNGKVTEVLARENLAFDDREKFYSNTPELKVLNEYVYGYLPNKNNCLGSTVYYYNYAQHFADPLSINFVATYNDEGRIKSLQSDGANTRLHSGEVLFKSVLYDCR